ncbi:hypothetical protein FACS189498_4100 [Spirochaetia bacterium]|nr:hypothetical protein FACS189498_4100 [Spirochaetia bacterium]
MNEVIVQTGAVVKTYQSGAETLHILKCRAVHPERSIIVETINGVTAASGEYAPILESSGFVRDRLRMALW